MIDCCPDNAFSWESSPQQNSERPPIGKTAAHSAYYMFS